MRHPASSHIRPRCFPTPGLILRTNDTRQIQHLRRFAQLQAKTAQTAHSQLATELSTTSGLEARIAALTTTYQSLEQWRHRIALDNPHPSGRYSAAHARRFAEPIIDDDPNLLRIGEHQRLKHGSVWDPATHSYVGGADTPASRTMRRIAAAAATRFAHLPSAQVICNEVALPGGDVTRGTRLLRGEPARQAAREMARRIAARGGDASRVVTDGDLLYLATAAAADRARTFDSAMALLATQHADQDEAFTAWSRAAYHLYQAPRTKRGSDATIRTFLIAAGTYLLGQPPVLPHDIDLLAYVHTQSRFESGLRAAQNHDVPRFP